MAYLPGCGTEKLLARYSGKSCHDCFGAKIGAGAKRLGVRPSVLLQFHGKTRRRLITALSGPSRKGWSVFSCSKQPFTWRSDALQSEVDCRLAAMMRMVLYRFSQQQVPRYIHSEELDTLI